jgi:hypothetical protein
MPGGTGWQCTEDRLGAWGGDAAEFVEDACADVGVPFGLVGDAGAWGDLDEVEADDFAAGFAQFIVEDVGPVARDRVTGMSP